MATTKPVLLIGIALVAGVAIAIALRPGAPGRAERASSNAESRPAPVGPLADLGSRAETSAAEEQGTGSAGAGRTPGRALGSPKAPPAPARGAQRPRPHGQRPDLVDPMARVMLGMVGSNPDAEAYWLAAINNPQVPAEERQDLIEDLNEDGFSNPEEPGPQDVALIVQRIMLIDALAPQAMDEVNAAAFAEARRDLVDMYQRLTGQ